MKLIFDTIEEALDFAARGSANTTVLRQVGPNTSVPAEVTLPDPEPAPEPEPEPAKPKRTRRTKKQIEAAAEPEPPAAEPEPATGELDEDAVKAKFRALVARDYNAAAKVMADLGAETFGDAVEMGKLAELDAVLS